MNYNPYAPPEATSAPPPPPGGFGPSQPWTATEAVSVAWGRFKDHWGVLVLASFVYAIIMITLGQIPTVLVASHVVEEMTPAYFGVAGVNAFFSQCIVASFFNAGMARMWLDTARGATPRFESLFSRADRFLPMVGLYVIVYLTIFVACAALIVPGVLLLAILQIAPYYVVEGRMGPIDALQTAWTVSKGQRGELVVLGVCGIGIAILGVVMCCIGWIFTTPVYWVATAVVFTRIAGMSTVVPATEAQRPAQPPYGPGPHDLPPWR